MKPTIKALLLLLCFSVSQVGWGNRADAKKAFPFQLPISQGKEHALAIGTWLTYEIVDRSKQVSTLFRFAMLKKEEKGTWSEFSHRLRPGSWMTMRALSEDEAGRTNLKALVLQMPGQKAISFPHEALHAFKVPITKDVAQERTYLRTEAHYVQWLGKKTNMKVYRRKDGSMFWLSTKIPGNVWRMKSRKHIIQFKESGKEAKTMISGPVEMINKELLGLMGIAPSS